jgi:hypothetical protein
MSTRDRMGDCVHISGEEDRDSTDHHYFLPSRDMIKCEGDGRVNRKYFYQCKVKEHQFSKHPLLTTPISILLNNISCVISANTIPHAIIT